MNQMITENETLRPDADEVAAREKLEKIDGALDKLKSQGAWLKSLLEGE